MNIEQAKKVLKAYIYCNETDCECYCDDCEGHTDVFDFLPAAKAVIAELERLEKYKWHDLRKDPNDLPEDYHIVLIGLTGLEGLQAGVTIAVHNSMSNMWGTGFCTYEDHEVSAWRELEPFEDVVEGVSE